MVVGAGVTKSRFVSARIRAEVSRGACAYLVEVVEVADVALGGGGGEREARGEGDDAEGHCGVGACWRLWN